MKHPLVSAMALAGSLLAGTAEGSAADLGPSRSSGGGLSPTWTGSLMGVQVGAGLNKGNWREGTIGALEPFGAHGEGAANYGFYAGYDWQFGQAVFGIEGGFSMLRGVVYEFPADRNEKFRTDYQWMFSTRLGGIVGDSLVYGRAGLGTVRSVAPVESWLEPTQAYLTSGEFGAGIEAAVAPHVTLRFEGVYLRAFEKMYVSGGAVSFQPDHLTARIGLALRPSPVVAKEPEVRNDGQWTGPYFGVMAGGVATSTVNGFGPVNGDLGPVSALEPSVGLYTGVSVQMLDRIVAGVEADGSSTRTHWNFSGDPSITRFASADLNVGAYGRVGYLVSNETLFYAKAGQTWLRVKPSEPYAVPGQPSAWVSGFALGGGVETRLASHLRARVDATYSNNLGAMRFEESGGTAFVRPEMLQVRFGLSAFY